MLDKILKFSYAKELKDHCDFNQQCNFIYKVIGMSGDGTLDITTEYNNRPRSYNYYKATPPKDGVLRVLTCEIFRIIEWLKNTHNIFLHFHL